MSARRQSDHYGHEGSSARRISPEAQFAGTMFDTPVTHEVPVRAHMRTVPGEAPPSGVERRDGALAAHETDDVKRIALAYVRRELVALYHARVTDVTWFGAAFVTADDVEQILRAWPECPPEIHAMPGHWKGAVFRGGWKQTGQSVRSVRPRMQATSLPCWAFVGETA